MKLDKRRLRKHPNQFHASVWYYCRTQAYADLLIAHLLMRGAVKHIDDDSEAIEDSNGADNIMFMNTARVDNAEEEQDVWQVSERVYYEFMGSANE